MHGIDESLGSSWKFIEFTLPFVDDSSKHVMPKMMESSSKPKKEVKRKNIIMIMLPINDLLL